MTHERFEQLLDELDGDSLATLKVKNRMYSSSDDALHNFISGADIGGGTPTQACWGYLIKHLVALRDKILNDDFSDEADLKEKCQDSINYIRFIWALAHETGTKNLSDNPIGICDKCSKRCDATQRQCYCCKHFLTHELVDCSGKPTLDPCATCKNGMASSDERYNNALFNWEFEEGFYYDG